MRAILEFNLPEDKEDFDFANVWVQTIVLMWFIPC